MAVRQAGRHKYRSHICFTLCKLQHIESIMFTRSRGKKIRLEKAISLTIIKKKGAKCDIYAVANNLYLFFWLNILAPASVIQVFDVLCLHINLNYHQLYSNLIDFRISLVNIMKSTHPHKTYSPMIKLMNFTHRQ